MFLDHIPDHFKDTYKKISNSPAPVYTMWAKFILKDGTSMEVPSSQITHLDIDHAFHKSVVPFYSFACSITAKQAAVLLVQHQDLMIAIEVSAKSPGPSGKSITVFKTEFLAILRNLPDVQTSLAQLPKLQHTKEDDGRMIDLDIELETIFNYKFLKTRAEVIVRDATVGDALNLVAGIFGFETTYIAPPDNTKKYTNIVIGPNASLPAICNMLQTSEAYDGVYASGISLYVMDKVLYILPKYDTVASPRHALFFTVSMPNGGQVDGTSLVDDTGLKILIVDPVETKSDFKLAAEDANAIQLVDPVRIANTRCGRKGGKLIVPETSSLFTNFTVGGAYSDGFTHRVSSSRNAGNITARLRLNQLSQSTMIWRNAIPNSIFPHTVIGQSFPSGNDVCNKRGVPCKVNYRLTKIQDLTTNLFECTAVVDMITNAT